MTAGARAPVTPLRALWLLTRLRLYAVLNQMASAANRPLGGNKRRKATPRKRNRWLVSGFVLAIMSFSFFTIARQSVINLHCHLDSDSACFVVQGVPQGLRAESIAPGELLADPFSPELVGGLSLVMSLVFLSSILMQLGAREMSQQDWDMEWLVTLPTSRATLLAGRVLGRTVANPVGFLTLWPACTMIAWYSGYRWAAPPVGVAVALPLLMLSATVRTLIDTGLRLSLQPAQLRNLQALITLISLPTLYLSMSYGTSALRFAYDWAAAFPQWATWAPPGLAVRLLNADTSADTALYCLLFLGEIGVGVTLGIALLGRQLRGGVVRAGVRESGRHTASRRAKPASFAQSIFTPIQRRELRLLSRDRNFLLQTLLLPVIVVSAQMLFSGRLNQLSDLGASPTFTAALAFGISAYVLMLSAFQTLNNEGGALWLLYSFPRSLESALKEKAQMWGMLALIYPVCVFALAIGYAGTVSRELLGLMLVVLVGIAIFSVIAVSLGIFACDPLAQDAQAKVRPTYTYGYMMLSGIYVYSIYSEAWWQKLVFMILTGGLAVSLWQKAREELPTLLDPVASPPARVSLADGMIAATVFFLAQMIGMLVLRDEDGKIGISGLAIAFFVAGALTYGNFRWEFWRNKTQGVPQVFGAGLGRSLAWGMGMCAVAALLGLAYMGALRGLGLWDRIDHATFEKGSLLWLALLTVVGAPLFEEFIFRGLIFGGLRRSTTPFIAATASAAIFAIVHPPASMLPVFALGVCAAVAYERTKSLLAPMLAHAGYNAAVLVAQMAWQ
ncbi:MAG TPA: type II CAAX endopeptidase family protein [Burkholderiaceae bacterium]